jgi:hypothetical protein
MKILKFVFVGLVALFLMFLAGLFVLAAVLAPVKFACIVFAFLVTFGIFWIVAKVIDAPCAPPGPFGW